MADPHTQRRMFWDLAIIMPCLMYVTVTTPYRLCFNHMALGSWLVFETTMDLFFILDIIVNFRTGYFVPQTGIIEYRPKLVARHYFKSWFALDALSGIPFGLFDMAMFGNLSLVKVLKSSRIIKAARVLRVLRLARILKSTKILAGIDREVLDWFEDQMNDMAIRSAVSMLKILLLIFLANHFLACVWVLIGRKGYKAGEEMNWLTMDGFTSRDTTDGGSRTRSVYLSSFYFCFTTITSVGYVGPLIP